MRHTRSAMLQAMHDYVPDRPSQGGHESRGRAEARAAQSMTP